VEYVRKLSTYVSQHKLLSKSHNLYKDTNSPLTQEQQAQFESIDCVSHCVKTEGMIHAEKKCQLLCMGEVDFSPDVNTAKGQHYVWQMIVHKWREKQVSWKKICCMAKAVGIIGNPLQTMVTLRDAKHSFKAADEEYQLFKLRAPMKCEEFLCDCAQDEALTTKVWKHAKQALGHKCQHDNARHLKHLQGKQCAGAITKVGICQGDDYFEYNDQAMVERLIMENNSAHFHLTEDTPPMMEPLLLELGYLANTEVAERILSGNYVCPPGTDQYT
jgi:hypothetical protein